jgi:hypothetical protein
LLCGRLSAAALLLRDAGEVPDLLGTDDLEEVGNALRPIMATSGMSATKMSIYRFFVSRYVRCISMWL